nr:hypothetical protein CFP56_75825 [Quercus suber]
MLASINTVPFSHHHTYALLSISLFSYLTQPPKPTRINTPAPSISFTPSPVNQPSTTTFGRFHRRTPLETPYTLFSQSFKGSKVLGDGTSNLIC